MIVTRLGRSLDFCTIWSDFSWKVQKKTSRHELEYNVANSLTRFGRSVILVEPRGTASALIITPVELITRSYGGRVEAVGDVEMRRSRRILGTMAAALGLPGC